MLHKNLRNVPVPDANAQTGNPTASKVKDIPRILPDSQKAPVPIQITSKSQQDRNVGDENNTPRIDIAIPTPEDDVKKKLSPNIPFVDNKPQPITPAKIPPIKQGNPLDILPSGNKFKPDIFDVDIEEAANQLNNAINNKQLIILHSSDGCTVLSTYKNGVLDGICVIFSRSSQPITLLNYKDARLDGVIKIWNEKGQRMFWCQYANGFRNGFCCCYKDDQFRLLLEIYHDTIRGVHLIENGNLEASFDPSKLSELDENAKNYFIKSKSLIYTQFNHDEKIFEQKFNEEYLRLQRELSLLMKSKGLNAVQNRIKEYNSDCQKWITLLRNSGTLKKNVW